MPLVRPNQDEIARLIGGIPEDGQAEGTLAEIASFVSSPFHAITSLLSGRPGDALRHAGRFVVEPFDIVIPGDVTKALGLEPEEVSGADLLKTYGFGRGARLSGAEGRIASGAVLGGTLAAVGGAGAALTGALTGAAASGPFAPVGAIVGGILGLGIGALSPAKNVRELAALPLEVVLDPLMWVTAGAKGVPLVSAKLFGNRWTPRGAEVASKAFQSSKLVTEARLAGQEIEVLKQVKFAFPGVEDDALRAALWPDGFDISKVRTLNLPMAQKRLAPAASAVGDIGTQLEKIEEAAKGAGELAGRMVAEGVVIAKAGGVEAAKRAGLLSKGGIRFAGMTIPGSPQAVAYTGRKVSELFRAMPGNVTIKDFFGIVDADMKAIQIDARNLHGEVVGKGMEMQRKVKPLLKELGPQTKQNLRRIVVESGPVGAENEATRTAEAMARYADAADVGKVETVNRLRRLFDESNQFNRRMGDRYGAHYDVLDEELQRALIVEQEAFTKGVGAAQEKITESSAKTIVKLAERRAAVKQQQAGHAAKLEQGPITSARENWIKQRDRLVDAERRVEFFGGFLEELAPFTKRPPGMPRKVWREGRRDALREFRNARNAEATARQGLSRAEMGRLRARLSMEEKLGAFDEAIERVESRSQAVLKSGAAAIADLQQGKVSGRLAKTQSAIQNLREALEQRPARVLQEYSLPMRRLLQRIKSGDTKALEDAMEALGKAEPGETIRIGADSISKAEFQSALLETATGVAPGGLGGEIRGASGVARERQLAATIEGTEVKRSLKPSELDPLLTNLDQHLQRIEGRSVIHRASKIIRGQKWADDRLQSISTFEDQPLVLIHDQFRRTATDVGRAAAVDMVRNKFGKQITEADKALMARERIPIEMTPGHAGRVEVKGIKGLEGYTLTPDQLNSLRRIDRAYHEPEVLTGVLGVFDRVQGWWKAQALVSPAYYSRNYQTALYQAWVATGHDDYRDYIAATRIQAADGRFGKLLQKESLEKLTTYLPFEGKTITGSELLQRFRRAGGQRPGFASTEVRATGGARRGITPIDDKIFEVNTGIGQGVEENVRLSLFRNLLRRGWDDLSAGREVGRVHFLYDMLSPAERNIARRIVPFYSWVRFNVPLTLRNAYESPGKFLIAKKVADYVEGHDELPPRSLTPEWVADNLGMRVSVDRQGRQNYVLMGSIWPAADVLELASNPVRKFFEQASPFLRMPAELQSGVHLGTDWPIERFPGEQQDFLGFSVRKRDIKLIQSIRVLNEVDRLVGPMLHRPGGAPRREDLRTFKVRMLNAVMGARAYPIDLEKVAAGVLWKKRREIGDLKSGYIRALVNEDADNARQAADGLLGLGVALPTDDEIRESLKRSKRRRETMGEEIRGALQALGLPR